MTAARVLDGQGDAIHSSAGTQLTAGAALGELQDHVSDRLTSSMLLDLHKEGATLIQTSETRSILEDLSQGLVTGMFDKAAVENMEVAKENLDTMASVRPVYARASNLVGLAEHHLDPQNSADVQLYLAQVRELQELPPLAPDARLGLVAEASRDLNKVVENLPDVSSVLAAQDALTVARYNEESELGLSTEEVATYLRESADGLGTLRGDEAEQLQGALHALANKIEAGPVPNSEIDSVREKSDELAASVAMEVSQGLSQSADLLAGVTALSGQNMDAAAHPLLAEVYRGEEDLSGTLARTASVIVELGREAKEASMAESFKAESSPEGLREFLGTDAAGISDADLKELFQADLAQQAASLGITPADVEAAVAQLQEQAAMEGSDPQRIDSSVALQVLVNEGLARESAEPGLAQGDGPGSLSEPQLDEPEMEVELEMDAGD